MRIIALKTKFKQNRSFWISILAAGIAGIIYCSWPLGYLLNPSVSRRGLASGLEALHQPYNWVFITLDVLSGLIILGVAYWLFRRSNDKLYKIVLVNFGLFGLLTLIDALLPMTCEPTLSVCQNWTHQPILILHGLASVVASICLFISAVLVWWSKRQKAGAFIMGTMMAGWCLFGIFSLYFFFRPGPGYLAQHYYITLCSVWVMLLPAMIRQPKPQIIKE